MLSVACVSKQSAPEGKPHLCGGVSKVGDLGLKSNRYAFNGSIDVLVLWDEGSLMEAQWIPQSRMRNHGEKELRDYFNAQLLFSSLWKHVLNIAEVRNEREPLNARSSIIIKSSRRCFCRTAW